MEKQNSCKSCNGTGEETDWMKVDTKSKCYSCDGTGIDCRYKDEIVCCYCGHEISDSYELNDHSDYECGECGKRQSLNVINTVEYTTSKVECWIDPTKHNWKVNTWYVPSERDGKVYVTCTKCKDTAWIPKEPSPQDSSDEVVRGGES